MNARWTTIAVMLSGAGLLAALSCSGEDTNSVFSTGGNTGAGGHGGATGSGGQLLGGNGPCADGDPCDNGGICAGGTCCAADKACASNCCGASDVCSFLKCETPGDDCVDASDCGPDEYCEYALGDPSMGAGGAGGGCMGGVQPPTGKCLPKPPICGPTEDPGDPPDLPRAVRARAAPGAFAPS